MILIKRLIFIPVCASCGERLSPFSKNEKAMRGNICFCDKCFVEWERAKAEPCPSCFQNVSNCFCTPDFFKKEQNSIPSLCFYHPERHDAQSNAIITMKRVRDRELFGFIAKELAPRIDKTLSEIGLNGRDCIFTWVPRKSNAISKSGFDQGRELCLLVKKELGGEMRPLFARIGGKEQKKLDKKERKKNADRSILLNSSLAGFPIREEADSIEEFVKNKNIVVIDDVMTSGATFKRAVTLLRAAGAKRVLIACVARSEERAKKS